MADYDILNSAVGDSPFFCVLKTKRETDEKSPEPPVWSVSGLRKWRKEMRTRITLACTECKNRNYNTTKDKKTHPERMEIKKYCKFCKKHTIHKETK